MLFTAVSRTNVLSLKIQINIRKKEIKEVESFAFFNSVEKTRTNTLHIKNCQSETS